MSLAVARYVLADLLRSQRFLVPVFVYLALLAVLFGGDPGPAPALWPASALALYPISAWLAITTANVEDPVQRHVTTAAAGGARVVAHGVLLVCLLADVGLTAVSVLRPLIPVVTTLYPYSANDLLGSALAHLATAGAGTAVGLLCARPVITRIGWSLLVATTVVVTTGATPWLPPVGTAVKALSTSPIAVPTVALDAGIGLALAWAACALTTLGPALRTRLLARDEPAR
jgi:hypothetical protein